MKVFIFSIADIFIAAPILLIFLTGRPVKSESGEDYPTCVCPMRYAPICATDSRTYSNPCDLSCAQRFNPSLLAVCHSECPCDPDLMLHLNLTTREPSRAFPASDTKSACQCTRIYMPVCGSDGVTYGNECLLECEHAKDTNIINLFDGECA